jgi:pyruvate/2-oxoglutarate dehydrogenase complex dihydrolipoamide dehydrogenase (E3) component
MQLAPDDEHNRQLVGQVHPPEWTNPQPQGTYNLVAIGGGTAGLVTAVGAAGLGAKVALVERGLLGGDCLNFGCVPSKALLRCGRAAEDVRRSAEFGCRVEGRLSVDFAAVMERMRRLRSGLARNDSAQRLRDKGVDVYLGEARFVGPGALEVAGKTLRFRRAVIATGGRPADPGVPGLAELGYLTNESVFSLTRLPPRMIVLGSGPIGCELAQAFRRFGSEVFLVNRSDRVLSKEEPEAAAIVRCALEAEGVQLFLGWRPAQAQRTGQAKSLILERGSERHKLLADEVLVAVGRQPNVEGLGLEAAGVATGPAGVLVDDRLRTTNRRIFAAGDCCTKIQFTHAADAMARLCLQNALFFGRARFSRLAIPRCTYTDPEVAQIGLTAEQAAAQGSQIDTYRVDLAEIDRAVLDGQTEGFAMIHTTRGSERMVGATVVAAHAGELIGELSLLASRGLPLGALATAIHCYPTQAEAFKRLGDEYQRTRLTPRLAAFLRAWFRWRR